MAPALRCKGHKTLNVLRESPMFSRFRSITSDADAIVAAISRSQAVIHFDMKGTVLHANENFLALMGFSLAEIQGKNHSLRNNFV